MASSSADTLCLRRRFRRKREREDRARPRRCGIQDQVAAVGARQLARHVEAKAGAVGSGLGAAGIAFEEAPAIGIGDPGPSIRDAQAHSAAARGASPRGAALAGDERHAYGDRRAPAVLHRVVQQAPDHLVHLVGVGEGEPPAGAVVERERDAGRAECLPGPADARPEGEHLGNGAKDDFLRGVSHNLQTPLARIRAYADQLAAEAPDRRLGIIAEQSDRLSRMVRQLLTVNRLDAGVLRPVVEVFALGACVRRAWEALGAPGVPFTLDDRSGGWLAYADPDQVDQVIWGLLDNAVKYGGGTPVTVSVALVGGEGGAAGEREESSGSAARAGLGPEGRAAGGGTLRVRVADAGPGIADADRGRLFERYARGTLPGAEGTGLGLYVSRELARANGGDLVVDPKERQAVNELAGGAVGPGTPMAATGAEFTLTLPAESPTEG